MLFCVSGLPLRILDTPQWKRLMETATKFKYKPTSSTMVSGTFIPAEAALVRSHQVAFLQLLVNLTITFDGGSTRKPSSVYTIHISTADRECFFMEGHDATDEKHTAAYIENLITSVRAEHRSSSRLPRNSRETHRRSWKQSARIDLQRYAPTILGTQRTLDGMLSKSTRQS